MSTGQCRPGNVDWAGWYAQGKRWAYTKATDGDHLHDNVDHHPLNPKKK